MNDEHAEKEIKALLEKNPNLGEVYKQLLVAHREKSDCKDNLAESFTKLEESIASERGLYTKDNKADTAKVKSALLKSAIKISKGADDKLAENLDIQDQFVSELKSGVIDKGLVDLVMQKEENLTVSTNELKDIKEGSKVHTDSDVCDLLSQIAEDTIKLENEAALPDDKKPKKPTKVVDETLLRLLKKAIKIA